MQEELYTIEKNKTLEIVEKSDDKEGISVKLVYKVKHNPDNSVKKNKARLVVKGYTQQLGIDYEEIFAHVTRLDTIKTLISLASQK